MSLQLKPKFLDDRSPTPSFPVALTVPSKVQSQTGTYLFKRLRGILAVSIVQTLFKKEIPAPVF